MLMPYLPKDQTFLRSPVQDKTFNTHVHDYVRQNMFSAICTGWPIQFLIVAVGPGCEALS